MKTCRKPKDQVTKGRQKRKGEDREQQKMEDTIRTMARSPSCQVDSLDEHEKTSIIPRGPMRRIIQENLTLVVIRVKHK